MTAMARLAPLLFVLWVGVTVSAEVDLQKRVIGGRQCGPNERRYHVVLIANTGSGPSLCGGSLISNRWILTAAHCWEQGWTLTAVLGRHPHPVDTMQIKEKPVIFKEKDIMKNDRFHDIMLLKLPNPTPIQPVGLPDCRRRPNIGDAVHIAGHGATAAGPNNQRLPGISNTLQCADIPVVDCQGLRNCLQKRYPKVYSARRHQHWFCGQSCQVDTCPGDSGGGVVFNDMIYGVHSFTGNPFHACTEAAGFMDVCGYMDWINANIGQVTGCAGCG